MSEAKGPYSENNYVGEPPDVYRLADSRDAIIANLSFAAGRASRDGMIKAIEHLINTMDDSHDEIRNKLIAIIDADGETK